MHFLCYITVIKSTPKELDIDFQQPNKQKHTRAMHFSQECCAISLKAVCYAVNCTIKSGSKSPELCQNTEANTQQVGQRYTQGIVEPTAVLPYVICPVPMRTVSQGQQFMFLLAFSQRLHQYGPAGPLDHSSQIHHQKVV